MKRFITAIIFFLLAITLCLTGYALCINRLNSINESLGKAEYVANTNDKQQAITQADNVKKEWEKASPILHAIVLHSDIHDMGIKIEMLHFYAENENYFEYKKACNEIMAISDNLKESQRPIFENIF